MNKKIKTVLWIGGLFLLNVGVVMLSGYDSSLSVSILFLFLIIAGFIFLATAARLVWVVLRGVKQNIQNGGEKTPSTSTPAQHSKKKVALWIICSLFFLLVNMHVVYLMSGIAGEECSDFNYFGNVYHFYTYDLLGIGTECQRTRSGYCLIEGSFWSFEPCS